MIQSIFIGISLVLSLVSVWNKPVTVWDNAPFTLGATNFPTSLDSLVNPSASDSVATVSHSGQHSNANDAIEALEAKLGITASTPVSGSVLAGNGTGSSVWTTYATTTSVSTSLLSASGLSTLTGFISNASSTVIGNLNITGNSTTTNATTTAFFSTTASTTNLWASTLNVGPSIFTIANTNAVTGNGTWDLGGASSFEIPNGSAPTVDVAGEIALDTTSNNLVVATSTTHFVAASATSTLWGFTASTTVIVSGTNIELTPKALPWAVTAIACKVTGGTSFVINLSDGTNDTNTVTCTTTWTQYAITSNNNWTAEERIRVEFGSKTGDTGDIVVDVRGYRTTD